MSSDKFRILAVDDDKDILELISIALEKEYDIITLADSVKAVEILETYEPDLIILDIMIPRVTGYQILEQLRKNPKTQNICVIILSAKDTSIDIKYGYKLGANLYVTKPFQPERLYKNIQMLLAQKVGAHPPKKTYSMRDVQLRINLGMSPMAIPGTETPHTGTDTPPPSSGPRLKRILGQERDDKWRG